MKFYDDGSFYDSYFAYGHEFGTSLVIRTDNESTAYEIAIDESPTISLDEVPEAYGFYFMQAKSCFAPDKGGPWYICSDTEFGQMVSETVLKCTGDRKCIGRYEEIEGFWKFLPEFPSREAALQFALEFIQEHACGLIEGYQYQSNYSGTGIVNVGHYEWLRAANADEIEAFKQAIPDE